jgi:hypothetical protein
MDILYKANVESQVLSHTAFYNDAVNDNVDVKEDFITWHETR